MQTALSSNSLTHIFQFTSCFFFTLDKEAICAAFNSSLGNMTLLDCDVECCSGNNCNMQNLTAVIPATPTTIPTQFPTAREYWRSLYWVDLYGSSIDNSPSNTWFTFIRLSNAKVYDYSDTWSRTLHHTSMTSFQSTNPVSRFFHLENRSHFLR